MKKQNKNHVYKTYEIISDWFDRHRSRELFEKPYLDKIITYLKSNTTILDLGCGTGEPIARYFIEKGFNILGIDGSAKQIRLAKQRFPDTEFIVADMRTINLNTKFDCIIAWHSFFHLPKQDQRQMFKTFENHINPGGILAFTSGVEDGEVWSDNGGEMLFHASLSTEEYHQLLTKHHFEVLCHNVDDKDCGDATIWLAKYNC